ncbi:putative MFS-type transporter C18.02 [Cladobotryum mycophilum]|uniref:MFS-type transporter C18.02 n=1 Tax=Cladobotryum mycophilum TaxID=491253 RepID=A0ABR0SBU9_9HYPO
MLTAPSSPDAPVEERPRESPYAAQRRALGWRASEAFVTFSATLAICTDTIVYDLVIPFLPQLFTGRLGTPPDQVEKWTALTLEAFGLSQLVFTWIAGYIVDRSVSKSAPMIAGLIILLFSTSLFFLGTTEYMIILARGVQGASSGLVWVSAMSFLVSQVDEENIGVCMGYTTLGMTVGELIGPLLGGTLYDRAGHWAVYAVVSTLVLIDLGVRLMVKEIQKNPSYLVKNSIETSETDPLLGDGQRTNGTLTASSSTGCGSESAGSSTPTASTDNTDSESISSMSSEDLKGRGAVDELRTLGWNCISSVLGLIVVSTVRFGFEAVIPLFVLRHFSWSASVSGGVMSCLLLPNIASPLLGKFTSVHGPRWFSSIGLFVSGMFLLTLCFLTGDDPKTRVLFVFNVIAIGVGVATTTITHGIALSVASPRAEEIAARAKATGQKLSWGLRLITPGMMMREEDIYDIIVVGAGPCGLATAARLREHTPAALFTAEEHRRYHWIGKYGNKLTLKHVRSGKISSGRDTKAPRSEYNMLILDATDDKWMGRWNRLFKTYDISHLRSPMLWHVDPLDRDSLLAHAYAHQREDELVEIRNCVGKEISKHAAKKKKKACHRACGGKQEARIAINLRERNDYYTPSQSLFCDHCEKVADRYKLGSQIIRKETVKDIDYGEITGVSISGEKLFTVTTGQTSRYARAVVLAVGPANIPKIPSLPSIPTDSLSLRQACHSMQIRDFPDPVIQQRMAHQRRTNILIVGGGLTSAQLSDLAIRRGVTKVWHIMRGPCRVKHFDVDLQWMGKYKNAEQARFWSADSDDERLEILKMARGGGSITPLFYKRLKNHIASGKLELRTETILVDAKLEDINGLSMWKIETEPPSANIPPMDYIYFATGIQTDYSSLPYLQTMMKKYPIHGHGGFPCISDDLMWKDDVPLFLVGRLAALRLGPAAPNIGGAKIGAERVAWAIEDLIQPQGESELVEEDTDLARYLSGQGNMYSTLSDE